MPVPALSSVLSGQSAGSESDEKSEASGTAPDILENVKEESPLDLEGGAAEGKREGEGAATAALLALQMVLVPPADAPMVIIQSVVRGLIARRRYRLMKVSGDPSRPRGKKVNQSPSA